MFSPRVQPPKNTINEEKMDTIIDAILQGKYSIACLLLLEATGYNPLQYIPYRTYNRLQKQRQQVVSANNQPKIIPTKTTPTTTTARGSSRRSSVTTLRKTMVDLDYVEPLSAETASDEGGGTSDGRTLFPWLKVPHFLTVSTKDWKML